MEFEHYLSEESEGTLNAVVETENCVVVGGGGFDCNICLEFVHEPVVTLCGHLYCWPCIYKWLHVQSASLAPDEPPQCPVCKDGISHKTMVPLYSRSPDAKASPPSRDALIPPRPPASSAKSLLALAAAPSHGGQQQRLPYRNPYQNQDFDQEEEHDDTSQMLNNLAPGFPHLVVGMFGEMFCAGVFGSNSGNSYANPNSYYLMGGGSNGPPRLRRQEMQADKSLNRISIFLFCCFFLCLIVF